VSVDDLLHRARSRLHRLAQRAAEGEVPGALIIERNVLEWRLDPASPHRIPEASSYDVQVVLLCSGGYATSLAAAALQDLGLRRATDVIGGFQAWAAAGLPTTARGRS
jgi:rhodanese-related sulfurtransferase